MKKGIVFAFGKLRSLAAPPLRVLFEYVPPARALALKLLKMRMKETVTVDGHVVHINPADFGIAFELQSTGTYEATSMRIFRERLRPGMTVIDIGAHVGLYTLQAARAVGPTGRVISFEPDTGNFSYLQRNILENGYGNVTPLQCAVSDTTGTITLYHSNFNTGDHRTYFVSGARKGDTVPVTTIDDHLRTSAGPVHFVKMDIEGTEEKAIAGMRETLQSNPSITMLVECCPDFLERAGTDPVRLLAHLESLGFRLTIIDDARDAVITGKSAEEIAQFCKKHSYANVLCER